MEKKMGITVLGLGFRVGLKALRGAFKECKGV